MAATIVNAGVIAAYGGGAGITLAGGGSVTNQSAGTIGGGFEGIYGNGGAVTVVNAGSIAGSPSYGVGVILFDGGSVTNQSGGSISGGVAGILAAGTATVVNAGTISGSVNAVGFVAGYADRLVIDPNAVFGGTVSGGNAIGAAQISTLELASAGSAGTLSGLGTQFVDFAQVTVDAGAQWTFTGANTIVAGSTLTNYGTLTDAGTLTNAGSLNGTLTLAAGGVFSNVSTGTITAVGGTAVYGTTSGGTTSGAATVVNAGVIADTNTSAGYGIDLTGGGSVTNQSGGSISGYDGIYGQGSAVTVVNGGSIAGNITDPFGKGVVLSAGGSVTNQIGGSISGYDGIYGNGGAVTVVNAGTISGSSYAVKFAAGSANRLIADPGAVFAGSVNGGGGVLELASAAGAGTLSGFGTSITNFNTLQFDAGAAWTVAGTDSASGLGGIAITGFADNDTIDLTGFVEVSETFSNNTLTLTGVGGVQATLTIDGSLTSGSFQFSTDGNGGTDITLCFCAGTHIGTLAGEVPVEKLKTGDMVLTAHNGLRAVQWIGHGKVLATRGRRRPRRR